MAKAREFPGVPADGPGAPAAPEGTKPPPFGSPVQSDPSGQLPRVCRELERAHKGCKRFKIRCDNFAERQTAYVLATSEDSAKQCFLREFGVAKEIERITKTGGKAEEPAFVVTELAD